MDGILERNRQLVVSWMRSKTSKRWKGTLLPGCLSPKSIHRLCDFIKASRGRLLGEGMGLAREPELPLGQNSEWQAGGIENQEGVEEAASSSVGFRHRVDADWKFLDRPHGDMAIFDPAGSGRLALPGCL